MRAGEQNPLLGFNPFYNNTCTTGNIALMNPGDTLTDHGQVPGPTNPQLPGCETVYPVNGFEICYCTDEPTIDMSVVFSALHQQCTDPASAIPTAQYFLSGLPGVGSGGYNCWSITVVLTGSSQAFVLLADGDGIWDNNPALDTFSVSYELTNITGTQSGIVQGGQPVFAGFGCGFGVGTIFDAPDPTGSAPDGTGYGSADGWGLTQLGTYQGCQNFGG